MVGAATPILMVATAMMTLAEVASSREALARLDEVHSRCSRCHMHKAHRLSQRYRPRIRRCSNGGTYLRKSVMAAAAAVLQDKQLRHKFRSHRSGIPAQRHQRYSRGALVDPQSRCSVDQRSMARLAQRIQRQRVHEPCMEVARLVGEGVAMAMEERMEEAGGAEAY